MFFAAVLFVFLFNFRLIFSQLPDQQAATKFIKVGLMIPSFETHLTARIGYPGSVGAINMAIDRIQEEHLLDDYNFTFAVRHDECLTIPASGFATQLLVEEQVDVIVGPTCNTVSTLVGSLAGQMNIPVMAWGLVSRTDVGDKDKYPTLTSVGETADQSAQSVVEVINHFGWERFALIYTGFSKSNMDMRCEFLASALMSTVGVKGQKLFVAFSRKLIVITRQTIANAFQAASNYARIFIVCFNNDQLKRLSMLALHDVGINVPEYVVMYMENTGKGYSTRLQYDDHSENLRGSMPVWYDADDDLENYAKEGALYTLTVDVTVNNTRSLSEKFTTSHANRATGWPWYCANCTTQNYNESHLAYYLHDGFYLYGLALNRSLQIDPENALRNGSLIASNARGTFYGYSGKAIINAYNYRDSQFALYGLTENGTTEQYISFEFRDNVPVLKANYLDAATTIWASRGGQKPLDVPICGFSGNACPVVVWDAMAPYVYGTIGVMLAGLAFILIYGIHSKKTEQAKLDALWQISYVELIGSTEKMKTISQSSLESRNSEKSKLTLKSMSEGTHYTYFYLDKDLVAARKFQVRYNIDRQQAIELRKLAQVSHDNLCRFVGFCNDGPVSYAIYRYCSRGSLRNIIEQAKYPMDGIFLKSIANDVISGIAFLGDMNCCKGHGRLTSKNCVVDDHWLVKLTDYGLHGLHQNEKVSRHELLWRAPEMIRNPSLLPNKKADIYSFGIVCSEVLTRNAPFGIDSESTKLDEVIYRIKRGGPTIPRPDLSYVNIPDLSGSILAMITECLAEDPVARPSLDDIRSTLLPDGFKTPSLMDHIFETLESYADTLYEEVESRTKELNDEKKKSDFVLYRMLPKHVAENLKSGKSVEPESYDSVTVFFSDVVKFTKLADQCSPLQVITLLNDLYTLIDNTIENHDVYKVETIGDGYLCVSGLPHRNGTEHVRQISILSLSLIKKLKEFRIPHLPDERVEVRIGAHSGPVTAAVVGLSMPRYCLFGDTVNTASRMESNGKPSKIQISSTTNALLAQVGGFVTELRGDVVIKGKGVMETYWLLSDVTEAELYDVNVHVPFPASHFTEKNRKPKKDSI